jgi:hypothetical protein
VISILIAPVVSRMLRFFPAGGDRHHHCRDRHQPDAHRHQLDFRQPLRPHRPERAQPEHAKWLADVTGRLASTGAVPPVPPKGLAMVGTVPNPKYAQPVPHIGIAASCWCPSC